MLVINVAAQGFIVFTIGAYTTPESLGCAFGNCTGDNNPQLPPLLVRFVFQIGGWLACGCAGVCVCRVVQSVSQSRG